MIARAGLVVAWTFATILAISGPRAMGAADSPLTVRAVDGWQDAAVDVAVGEALTVRYITGTWTINVPEMNRTENGSPTATSTTASCQPSSARTVTGVSSAAATARGPMKALNGAIVQPNAGHAMVNVRKGVIV